MRFLLGAASMWMDMSAISLVAIVVLALVAHRDIQAGAAAAKVRSEAPDSVDSLVP